MLVTLVHVLMTTCVKTNLHEKTNTLQLQMMEIIPLYIGCIDSI